MNRVHVDLSGCYKAQLQVNAFMDAYAAIRQRPTVQKLVGLTRIPKQTVSVWRRRWIEAHPESDDYEEVG